MAGFQKNVAMNFCDVGDSAGADTDSFQPIFNFNLLFI
jgi:hypothetical protein